MNIHIHYADTNVCLIQVTDDDAIFVPDVTCDSLAKMVVHLTDKGYATFHVLCDPAMYKRDGNTFTSLMLILESSQIVNEGTRVILEVGEKFDN